MESCIYAAEAVDNTERKFGSAQVYFPAMVEEVTGERRMAFFTADEVTDAINRGYANPEDAAPLIDAYERSERGAVLVGCTVAAFAGLVGYLLGALL